MIRSLYMHLLSLIIQEFKVVAAPVHWVIWAMVLDLLVAVQVQDPVLPTPVSMELAGYI